MLIDTPTTHQTNKPKETEDNATELALVAPKSTKIGPNAAEVPCHPIRAAEPVLKPISGSKLKIPAKVTPKIFSMIIIKMITATNCNPILPARPKALRSEEHTSELQSRGHLVCRLLLEKYK